MLADLNKAVGEVHQPEPREQGPREDRRAARSSEWAAGRDEDPLRDPRGRVSNIYADPKQQNIGGAQAIQGQTLAERPLCARPRRRRNDRHCGNFAALQARLVWASQKPLARLVDV